MYQRVASIASKTASLLIPTAAPKEEGRCQHRARLPTDRRPHFCVRNADQHKL